MTSDRLPARGHEAVEQTTAASTPALPERNADWSSDVSTKNGYVFRIRQASNADESAASAFSAEFDPEGKQLSILNDLRHLDERHMQGTHSDDLDQPKLYLAIESETDRILAIASAIRDQNHPTVWAVLISRLEYKGGGIRSRLLEHLVTLATAGSISTLIAIEEHSDDDPSDMDQQAGFVVSRYKPDPRYIVLSKTM